MSDDFEVTTVGEINRLRAENERLAAAFAEVNKWNCLYYDTIRQAQEILNDTLKVSYETTVTRLYNLLNNKQLVERME